MSNKNDLKRIIILIAIGVVSYLLVSNFSFVINVIGKIFDSLFPFILGIVLAFILNIPMVKIEKLLKNIFKNRKMPYRVISITISLIIFILFFLFIAFQLIPDLISNIESLIKSLPNIFKDTQDYLVNLAKGYPTIQDKINNFFTSNQQIDEIITSVLNYLVNSSISFITSIVTSLITLFTSLIFAIYMLSQKEYLIKGTKKVIRAYFKKNIADKIINMGNIINVTFSKFVSGQCLEAVILGVILFVVMTIFRFPYTLLISVLTCVTALIPIFGSLIAAAVGAILIATTSPLQALIFIIVFVVIQQIEGNLIYPKVVGKSVGLSPIWTLLAVTVGGKLFGVVGMLVGLPLASIIYALIKKDVNYRLRNE